MMRSGDGGVDLKRLGGEAVAQVYGIEASVFFVAFYRSGPVIELVIVPPTSRWEGGLRRMVHLLWAMGSPRPFL